MRKLFTALLLTACLGASLAAPSTEGCSWAVNTVTGQGVQVGHNIDWADTFTSFLYLSPRGYQHQGGVATNPAQWQAKYGSILLVTSQQFRNPKTGQQIVQEAPFGGMNEKGVQAALLWLNETDYGKRDLTRPGLSVGLLVQYILDNCATVSEAVAALSAEHLQVQGIPLAGGTGKHETLNLHLAIADKAGDCAVVEFIAGRPVIYHSKEYRVMTNSPVYARHLQDLPTYSEFGGTKEIPGRYLSEHRFVKGHYALSRLPQHLSKSDAVRATFSVMHFMAQPFAKGTNLAEPFSSHTLISSVADLTHLEYYTTDYYRQTLVYVDLNKIDFAREKQVKSLRLSGSSCQGDVTQLLTPSAFYTYPVAK